MFAVESSIDVAEGENRSYCVQISNISPFGGLETDVTVTIQGEGIDNLTGKFCISGCSQGPQIGS